MNGDASALPFENAPRANHRHAPHSADSQAPPRHDTFEIASRAGTDNPYEATKEGHHQGPTSILHQQFNTSSNPAFLSGGTNEPAASSFGTQQRQQQQQHQQHPHHRHHYAAPFSPMADGSTFGHQLGLHTTILPELKGYGHDSKPAHHDMPMAYPYSNHTAPPFSDEAVQPRASEQAYGLDDGEHTSPAQSHRSQLAGESSYGGSAPSYAADIAYAPWNPMHSNGERVLSPGATEQIHTLLKRRSDWPVFNTSYQDSTAGPYGNDPGLHLKLQSLPMLDRLASQILVTLARLSFDEIEQLVFGEDSEERQAYMACKSLFDQTRKVYTKHSSFILLLTASDDFCQARQDVLIKANRATFLTSLLQFQDTSLEELHENFLSTFNPLESELFPFQTDMFIAIKTQLYITYVSQGHERVHNVIDALFSIDAHTHGASSALPTPPTLGADYAAKLMDRRQALQSIPPDVVSRVLPYRYPWRDFLATFHQKVRENIDCILNPSARHTSYDFTARPVPDHVSPSQEAGSTPDQTSCSPYPATAPVSAYSSFGAFLPREGFDPRIERHLQSPTPSLTQSTDHSTTTAAGPRQSSSRQQAVKRQGSRAASSSSSTATAAPPSAAASTAPAAPPPQQQQQEGGGGGASTSRQPWRPEEEAALLKGLEEVKGPHWSRILSLHGRSGTHSDVLRDRNQIQLKDKARNLKLSYLKSGVEPPACLAGVTGNLRKRGGVRYRAAAAAAAAAAEAEAEAEAAAEDEDARRVWGQDRGGDGMEVDDEGDAYGEGGQKQGGKGRGRKTAGDKGSTTTKAGAKGGGRAA